MGQGDGGVGRKGGERENSWKKNKKKRLAKSLGANSTEISRLNKRKHTYSCQIDLQEKRTRIMGN